MSDQNHDANYSLKKNKVLSEDGWSVFGFYFTLVVENLHDSHDLLFLMFQTQNQNRPDLSNLKKQLKLNISFFCQDQYISWKSD